VVLRADRTHSYDSPNKKKIDNDYKIVSVFVLFFRSDRRRRFFVRAFVFFFKNPTTTAQDTLYDRKIALGTEQQTGAVDSKSEKHIVRMDIGVCCFLALLLLLLSFCCSLAPRSLLLVLEREDDSLSFRSFFSPPEVEDMHTGQAHLNDD